MISFFQKLVWLYRRGYLLRDFKNIARYGYFEAPRAFEQICVNPSLVKESVTNPRTREHSALVIDGDWDLLKRRQIQNLPKVKMCRAHFEDGLSWEKSGIIDYATRRIKRQGKYDDCMSVDDVIQRYNNLDELYSTLKVGQPFLPQSKLFENSIREKGGIIIHVGRNRELLFGGGGHRDCISDLFQTETNIASNS